MARDPQIEARLQRWAQWVQVGDGSGYPVMSVLHPSWSPPAGGIVPGMKVSTASDAPQTHRAVQALPLKLRNAVAVHYVIKGSIAEQALRMECAEPTVHLRVERAHQALRLILANTLAAEPGTFCNIEESG